MSWQIHMLAASLILTGLLDGVLNQAPAESASARCPGNYPDGSVPSECSRAPGTVCSVVCEGDAQTQTRTSMVACSSDATWHPTDNCKDFSNECKNPDEFNNGLWSESSNPKTVHYSCHPGYALKGPPKQACTRNGTWDPPDIPVCVKSGSLCEKPFLINGVIKLYRGGVFVPGDHITVQCNQHYAMRVDNAQSQQISLYCSQDGRWVTAEGWPVNPECSVKLCGSPPEVPHSQMGEFPSYSLPMEAYGEFIEGQEVMYKCDPGHTLVDPKARKLVCKNGDWLGDLPSCVKSCPAPAKIANGVAFYPEAGVRAVSDFRLGFVVSYKCNPGYKLLGYTNLVCLDGPKWSNHPPQCILDEESGTYCKSLSQIANGHCFCETKSDLLFCEPFYRGLHVECTCNEGFRLVGQAILTCKQTGQWDYGMPSCVAELEIDSKTDLSTENQSHMSTLAIVVATACSVLGVLLLIMVIMVFRRRKPHPPRLCRPSSTPPPYSRVHSNSLDEHDRALLMGYENNHIALPSYEEATNSNQQGGGSFGSRSGSQVGEYRPLPSIPSGLRSMGSLSGDSCNRHSIITSSTMNRDGISEVFGSIDTVNVSMSDASTAVTIETLDSASSHHSNMSRRATAGSIDSSNNSLVTEDVPLLENNERNERRGSDSSDDDVQNKPED